MQKLSHIIIAVTLLISGCASSSNMAKLSLGMNKSQVTDILGEPDFLAAQGSDEVYTYSLYNGFFSQVWYSHYNVNFRDGRIIYYGR